MLLEKTFKDILISDLHWGTLFLEMVRPSKSSHCSIEVLSKFVGEWSLLQCALYDVHGVSSCCWTCCRVTWISLRPMFCLHWMSSRPAPPDAVYYFYQTKYCYCYCCGVIHCPAMYRRCPNCEFDFLAPCSICHSSFLLLMFLIFSFLIRFSFWMLMLL